LLLLPKKRRRTGATAGAMVMAGTMETAIGDVVTGVTAMATDAAMAAAAIGEAVVVAEEAGASQKR
jgi:hypothetical protein